MTIFSPAITRLTFDLKVAPYILLHELKKQQESGRYALRVYGGNYGGPCQSCQLYARPTVTDHPGLARWLPLILLWQDKKASVNLRHGFRLQCFTSFGWPWHKAPSLLAGILMALVRFRVPAPQVFEHCPQVVHRAHWQSTAETTKTLHFLIRQC